MPDPNYDSGEEEMEDKPDKEESEDSSDDNTALLSKSFFRNKDNLKPGAIEKIKILEIMDDEVVVECQYEKKDSKDEKSDERSSYMKKSESDMDTMMETAE